MVGSTQRTSYMMHWKLALPYFAPSYVQAISFCNINALTWASIDESIIHYPSSLRLREGHVD